MNKFLLAGLLAFLPSVALADEASMTAAKAAAAQYDKMCNEHNLKGMVDLFTKNALYVPGPTASFSGQEAISKFYEPIIKNLSNHVITIDAAEQLAPNVIVTMQRWVTDSKDDKGAATHIKGYATMTMTKVGDDWKLAALAWTMPPEPNKEASK